MIKKCANVEIYLIIYNIKLSLRMESNQHVLEWQNVSFSVKLSKPGLCSRKTEKNILENVSGRIKSGTTCAIMGPSGKLNQLKFINGSYYFIPMPLKLLQDQARHVC